MIDVLLSQLTDVFRMGLIVALVITTNRTAAVTGRVLPLILGVVFVAVILPATLPVSTVSLTQAISFGLISNSIILVHVMVFIRLIARFFR